MKEKKAAAQEALLDRIAGLAPTATADMVKDLAEAYSYVKGGDFSKERRAAAI